MGELLTILAIGLALEYLLGWAFDRKPDQWADSRRDWEDQYVVETELVNGCLVCNASPGEDCKDGCPVGSRNYKPRRCSPIMSIQEILPRVPGQRNFRVIAAPGASPIELEPYMPFGYGDNLPDAQVVTGIEYEREHLTKSHATWEVRYTLSPSYFTSNGRGLSATEYAARLFSIGCLTANEVRQAGNLPQFPPMEDGCNV
jgi:hypothetical protein